MYETESDSIIKQIFKVLIAILIFFIIIPFILSIGNDNPKYEEQMSGNEDPYWSP